MSIPRQILAAVALVVAIALALVAYRMHERAERLVDDVEAIMKGERKEMAWTHYFEGGGSIDVDLQRDDYPTLDEYQESVQWHLERWPPNDPPTGR